MNSSSKKPSKLIHSMFKLDMEVMKVRLVALRTAFQVTDDSKALQVIYNYSRIHSKFVSVK